MSVTSARRRVHMLLRNARRRPSNLRSLRRMPGPDTHSGEPWKYSSYRSVPVSGPLFDSSSEMPWSEVKGSLNRRDGD